MKFTNTLIKGKLIKRYKRFFTDIKVNNSIVTAHCPNTGSMRGLLDKNNTVFLSKNDDPKRKLKFTLEIIEFGLYVDIELSISDKILSISFEKFSFE